MPASDGLEHWWQRAIIYNIYPRSFQDSNGDGIGDLPGILRRVDYLADLGIDTVWLSPVYPSPMADGGYDVADYGDVGPLFGSMADFDKLLEALHARGIKLLMDFVPNHTSNQHPWFVTSRATRDNLKRDWYIWHDPAPDGGPPNNWLSNFGGSAWEWDATTRQYYLHSFLKEQPDLNWRNPAVRRAMYDLMRFWLAKGVDGFRVDVIWLLIKDDAFRDDPPNLDWKVGDNEHDKVHHVYDSNRPETIEIVEEMRAVLDEFGDRLLVGEIYLPTQGLMAYYGKNAKGAQIPFNFALIDTDWNAANLAQVIRTYEAALPPGAWPNWVLSNLDQSRIGTRIGERKTRVAAMLQMTLRGTPTMYYGEELGLLDVPISRDQVQDAAETHQPGIGQGRDPERTPMPWDASVKAGFTTGTPWLPLNPDHVTRNVAVQSKSPASMLALYRALLVMRKTRTSLVAGALERVTAHGDVLSYVRRRDDEETLVLLNLGDAPQTVVSPLGRLLLSTHERAPGPVAGDIMLGANEGIVVIMGEPSARPLAP